jgi:DNA repair exonuclease SbcCD ATPase subunit
MFEFFKAEQHIKDMAKKMHLDRIDELQTMYSNQIAEILKLKRTIKELENQLAKPCPAYAEIEKKYKEKEHKLCESNRISNAKTDQLKSLELKCAEYKLKISELMELSKNHEVLRIELMRETERLIKDNNQLKRVVITLSR